MCNCNNCKENEFELLPELEAVLGEYQNEYELFYESGSAVACAGITTVKKTTAVTANRAMAKEIGWGCLVGGKVNPIPQLTAFLSLPASASEDELVCAVGSWQATKRIPVTGILDKRTWDAMQILRKLAYPSSTNVYYRGKRIGILEKVAPYSICYLDAMRNCQSGSAGSSHGGMQIQWGFRITDMDTVKKAGFVDSLGNPHFRWVQTIETNQTLNQTTRMVVKKYSKYVDPNATPGKFDENPYYWNEAGGGLTYALVQDYINKQAFGANSTRLCYDLIFYDRPSRALSEAKTGKRVFWNAEMALVGVRPGKSNFILNSVKWGFDIIINAAGNPEIKPNGMNLGSVGGSSLFRATLNNAINMGQFPGHCFFGSGFSGKALCR